MKYICATCLRKTGELVIHDTENDPHMRPPRVYLPLMDINNELHQIEKLLVGRFEIPSRDHNYVHNKIEDSKRLIVIARRLLMEALAYKEDEL